VSVPTFVNDSLGKIGEHVQQLLHPVIGGDLIDKSMPSLSPLLSGVEVFEKIELIH
jgi:hypothetical protein